ncbi:helix-turn-helix transcriptional regulator [Jiangella alkaliphila]|uniref:Predicted DNA-binding transcriptional regulator YafY, contains an HTH and WYL domains n=1 Tax=Jiangella alkaliphila TaxID=419479 RepID=A0A1H2L242_9ACTN|nr:WYL domain-containing protein [Jiangella alkaliphila]SDU75063.1 Predicted DNA-binding transcriptional regulator YafY, contains an HTH and WYL domains [Jiangella alkaliphila]
MRAERLVQIILLLQTHGRLTAGELARRLEVSARTVQRDLDALSAAGFPVYADRGRAGGWSLAADYRTRLTGLSPAETAALFVASTAHVLADLGLDAAAGTAEAKLLATVPAHARRHADLARERVLVDHADWMETREPSPWLPVLQRAVWDDTRVHLTYGSAPHAVAVEPLGLVAKKRSWYLVARKATGEFRTYRVDRIVHADGTDERFERPDAFDLTEHWRHHSDRYFAELRRYPVRLRVRGYAATRLRWARNAVIDAQTAPDDDGWANVSMTFESAYETRVYLLGLAGDVVVLEPADLRDDMRRAATEFLAQN